MPDLKCRRDRGEDGGGVTAAEEDEFTERSEGKPARGDGMERDSEREDETAGKNRQGEISVKLLQPELQTAASEPT